MVLLSVRRPLVVAALLLTSSWWLAACGGPEVPEVAGLPEVVDFNYHVKPILSDRCFACHGPDDRARKAGLRLDTEEGARALLESGQRAIVAGSLSKSELVRRITAHDESKRMPPAESNLSLSDYEVAVLARWIDQGASWKPHWSFIAPDDPEPPAVEAAAWPRNEIDRFVLARLEREGLAPAPEAERERLLRRVSLDLIGLPPTIEEVDAFLADRSPDAYEKVVDRLLASPHYGERMAIAWLDLARYADTHGYQDDGMRTSWPWRDWVIRAFNDNMPYDRFVAWQLAGDLLPQPTQEQLLATSFNRNHMQSQEGGIVPEEYRVEYVADRVNTFGRAFLGLTVECARCHDHKYDPITQKEYYELFAFFNNVNEWGQIPYAGEPSPTVILHTDSSRQALAALRERMAPLERAIDPAAPAYDAGFEQWLARVDRGELPAPTLPKPAGRYPLDEMRDYQFANTAGGEPATLKDDVEFVPETIEGMRGSAQKLVGTSFIDLGDKIGIYERNQPFSIALWVRVEKDSVEGPIFSRSGGIFNGNRSYDCILHPDGTLTASINHNWPDNSIELETTEKLEPGSWYHLAFTYDGSSRASGLRLYLNGRPAQTRVLADRLTQSILHRGDGKNHGRISNLRLGRRFDATLEDVSVDDLHVFETHLSPVEVRVLAGVEPVYGGTTAARTAEERTALRAHYVARHEPEYAKALAALTRLRGEENELLSPLREVMVMRERRTPRQSYVLDRGAYDAPADPVEAGTPAAVGSYPEELPRTRLGLARWLFDPDHPLTARVAVNRLWAQFFGRGLVSTPEDFGNQGALPSHPELLDWLAATFVESGWDMKALQKLIVTSATYRQRSWADPEVHTRDPDNVLLARGPGHRLPAELVRDQALAASGLLVREIGGPPVKPYQPAGLWKELATRNEVEYIQDHGDKLYRRSLYTIWKRTTPPPSMISFDAAERNLCVVRRQRTNTPLQSLILMNDPQLVEAARVLAERMMREGGESPGERIGYGFRAVTSRQPEATERRTLQGLYEAELADFRRDRQRALELLAVGEYPRDASLDPAEAAAYTVVATTLLNFDEAIFKR